MADYPYEQNLVVDPDNPENIVRDGEVWLYATDDVDATTPLALKDPSGLPLAQPLVSNRFGFLSPFVAPVPQVRWKSGPFENYYNSFTGLLDQATAAALAAQAAQLAAEAAAASAQQAADPTDEQLDAAARRVARPSNLALSDDGVPYILDGANEVFIVRDAVTGFYFFDT